MNSLQLRARPGSYVVDTACEETGTLLDLGKLISKKCGGSGEIYRATKTESQSETYVCMAQLQS